METRKEMMIASNMNPEDFEIAMKLQESDDEFRALWEEHLDLKQKLNDLRNKPYLTSQDELEVKRIKRIKLAGKDKIAVKIREYKEGVVDTA